MNTRGLRFKLMLVLALSLLVLFVVQFFTARSVLTQGYSKLESEKTRIQVESAKNLIEQQYDQLSDISTDWAHWDDTYEFVAQPDPKYIEANYTDDTFSHLRVHAILLTDNQGKIIYQRRYKRRYNEDTTKIQGRYKDTHFVRKTKWVSFFGCDWLIPLIKSN